MDSYIYTACYRIDSVVCSLCHGVITGCNFRVETGIVGPGQQILSGERETYIL